MSLVHVVMGNDYPAAVFDSLVAAEAYCVERRAESKKHGQHVHWRTYDFELQTAAAPEGGKK